MRMLTITFLCLLACAAVLPAEQVPVQVYEAELAVPFGSEPGFLVTTNDQLLFINSKSPTESFAMTREFIREFNTDNDMVGFVVTEPLRDQKRFTFRLVEPGAAATLANWDENSGEMVGPRPTPAEDDGVISYRAQHNHFVTGHCEGHLIITDELISYESLSRAEHSRQWKLGEVQEIRRKNPYRVSINPFTGAEYDFRLLQDRMSNVEYKQLSASIAETRASQ